jgi:hypothetical protein
MRRRRHRCPLTSRWRLFRITNIAIAIIAIIGIT